MITLKNINQFLEGNTQMILDNIGMKPKWYQEQIAYRMLQCKDDCVPRKSCVHCGCAVPGKMYVKESCNKGRRFPDLFSTEAEWNAFKRQNGIN